MARIRQPETGFGKDQRRVCSPGWRCSCARWWRSCARSSGRPARELLTYTWVVLVFVVFMAGLIALFDLGLARIVFALFGE